MGGGGGGEGGLSGYERDKSARLTFSKETLRGTKIQYPSLWVWLETFFSF